MSDTPTPPTAPIGYKLIDPAKDGPKRWDDLVWDDASEMEQWLQVTCEFGKQDLGTFVHGFHYARRIADNAPIPAVPEKQIRLLLGEMAARLNDVEKELERIVNRQN